MRKLLKSLALALVAAVLISSAALAYSYSASVTVTESASTSYGMLPIAVSVSNTYLADNNLISPSGLDTRVLKSSTELPHMLADSKTLFASPIGANTQEGFTYTLGDSPLSAFKIIAGYNGYVTVADAAALELGNNFAIEQKGWVDTSAGSNKNLVYKQGAFRTYVSPTTSGNIPTEIWGGTTWLSPTGYTDPSAVWISETNAYDENTDSYAYSDFAATSWSGFLQLSRASTDLNSIRYWVSGNVPAMITQIDIDYYYSAGWHDQYQGAVTTGSWQILTASALGVTDIRIRLYNNDSVNRRANIYEVDYGQDTVQASVTATGVSSGERIVKTTYDGANLKIFVDGVEKDSVAWVGSVPDNANNWLIDQNNVMPYMDYYKQTVSGTLISWYQPVAIISGTTLPDRAGTAQNGVITWGSNPAGVAVEVGGLLPVTTPVSVSGLGESTFVPSVGVDMQTTGTEGANLPLYGLFKSLLTDYANLGGPSIPMANFWKLVAVIIGWSVGTAVMLLTKNVAIGLAGYFVGFAVPAYAMADPILDVWVPIVYGIGAVCLAALLWKWTSSSMG